MPETLTHFITSYGYIAVFSLVFLQEIGIPNPVPNELVLIFGGYLAFTGVLSFWLVVLTAVLADFSGTTALYVVFYFSGKYVMSHIPKWIPFSQEKLDKLSKKLSQDNPWSIYVGRLIPYLRGYTSLAAGLLQIRPRTYLTAVLVSAITWSGGYVIVGKLTGKYWEQLANKIGGLQNAVLWLVVAVAVVFGVRYLNKKRKKKIMSL